MQIILSIDYHTVKSSVQMMSEMCDVSNSRTCHKASTHPGMRLNLRLAIDDEAANDNQRDSKTQASRLKDRPPQSTQ